MERGRARPAARCPACRARGANGPPARAGRLVGAGGGHVQRLRRAGVTRRPGPAPGHRPGGHHRGQVETEIGDVQATLAAFDRKARLAPRSARDLGWSAPGRVARILVVGDTRANRRRLATHAATISSVMPAGGRSVRRWLRAPQPRQFGGVLFLPFLQEVAPGQQRRVRVARPGVTSRSGPQADPTTRPGDRQSAITCKRDRNRKRGRRRRLSCPAGTGRCEGDAVAAGPGSARRNRAPARPRAAQTSLNSPSTVSSSDGPRPASSSAPGSGPAPSPARAPAAA